MIESPSAPQSSRVCDTALGTEREASLNPLLAEEPGSDLYQTWGELWHCEVLFGIPGALQFSVGLKIEGEVERSDEMSCVHP